YFPEGWFWYIPLARDETSVGCVLHQRTVKARPGDLEALFAEMIERCHAVRDNLRGAERVTELNSAANFAYTVEPMTGDRFVCVGDAGGFVDPIFSPGVFLALQSAELAAQAICRGVRAGRLEARQFRGYERAIRRGTRHFDRFIESFYDRAFVDALLLAVFAAPGAAADTDTMFKIRRASTIIIGYSEAAKPFSFLGPDGKPAGYSVDLCREIAAGIQRDLNLPRLEIKWVKLPPDARISAVVSGRVDIECGSTTRTLSREAQVDFTNLTFVDGASLLVTAASGIQRPAQLAGKRIAVVQTSTTERVLGETLKRFSITNATIFAVKDHPEALTALEDGKIDVYASDRVILAGLRAGARDPA